MDRDNTVTPQAACLQRQHKEGGHRWAFLKFCLIVAEQEMKENLPKLPSLISCVLNLCSSSCFSLLSCLCAMILFSSLEEWTQIFFFIQHIQTLLFKIQLCSEIICSQSAAWSLLFWLPLSDGRLVLQKLMQNFSLLLKHCATARLCT